MKPQVEAKLNNILSYPFFQSVGGQLPAAITSAKTWQRAIAECDSRRWKNNRLIVRNYLFDQIQRKSWDRGQAWGPLSDEIRPAITSSADRILSKVSIPEQFIERTKSALSWDIMLICFEYEYSDLVEPMFYIPLLEPWYAAGHFPCGWDGGEFPENWDGIIYDGKVIVF